WAAERPRNGLRCLAFPSRLRQRGRRGQGGAIGRRSVFLTLILRSRPQVGFTRLANLMSISGRPEIEGGVSKDEEEEKYASTGFLVLRGACCARSSG
ncbi:MAG: hypothetical protein CTY36_18300, partial [Methylocystis sp.]